MNSHQDSNLDLEKRLLLALLISMAVLLGAPYLYEKFYPLPPQPEKVEQQDSAGGSSVVPPLEDHLVEDADQETQIAEQQELAATSAEPLVFKVENEDLLLTFDNAGAVMSAAHLKKYRAGSGDQVEIISSELPDSVAHSLAVEVGDEILNETVRGALYQVSGVSGPRVAAPVEFTFEYRGKELEVRKRVQVPASGYRLQVSTEVRKGGRIIPFRLVVGTGIGSLDPLESSDFAFPTIALRQGGSIERWDEGDLDEGSIRLDTTPEWLGLDSKYFACILVNPPQLDFVELSKVAWKRAAEAEAGGSTSQQVPLLSLKVGASRQIDSTLFLGPKDVEVLRGVETTLPGLVDYGWFGVLVRPLLFCLKVLNGFLENFGWSIILLTFLINMALFPVRYKQMASMKKMTDLQPKLRSIQDKYKRMKKDDPRRQQMNQEVMALYREHGVNPLGGCLPLLIQMPFLFAFYRMLDVSMELRGAPFMLWIQDLSRPDPYYATPIIMGLSMVFQQKISPSVGDPSQKRMMMMLPLVFTFFFLNVSSGLALYFLFSNLFGIIFQLGLQKWRPDLAGGQAGGKKSPAKRKK